MDPRIGEGAEGKAPAGRRLRFGEFLLDTASQQLLRGDREISLAPKAFRVLSLLAFHPGEVVTKDRLLDEVWADVHVLEGVVKVCIAEIRRALGETAARPRHLHTVQRRGYRFEGPITDEPAAAHLAAPTESASEVLPVAERAVAPRVSSAPQGERRQLTLVACQISDLSDLQVALDEDAFGSLLGVCQQAFSAVVRSLGGRVTRDLQDGLVACFGYPTSFEDDAGRALRAALRMLERAPSLSARCARELSLAGGRSLELRIGVCTGPVEVEHGAEPENLQLGEPLERAHQHAAQATPGTAVLGDATRRLVEGSFVIEPLEEPSTEAGPARLFRVLRPTGSGSWVDLADATQLTSIVGREQELSLILDRWERARDGLGQGLLLIGEAGIGKSRLVHTLHEEIREQEHGWIVLRGSAFHRNSSFHPVIELLRHSFRLTPDDAPDEQVARIEAGLQQTALPVAEALALIADLLALPLPSDLPLLQLSPEMHRKRTLELMCEWLLTLAERRPLVLIAEDLHWADPSTVEFLGLLLEQSQTVPLLMVMTHRPGFDAPWATRPDVAVLPLAPLTRKQVDAMVDDLAGGRTVPRSVRDSLVSRADGVPLFVEELTKNVLESELLEEIDEGSERKAPLPSFAVPTTLQDSLEARLERLGPSKELCQLAAVLGREFSHALLEEVAEVDAAALEALLQPLLDAGLLYRRGAPPAASYTFKHALIHETAYRSLLTSARRELHARVARALEARFPEQIDAEPESVARHYEEAGFDVKAIEAFGRAGTRATAASANVEAIAHLRQALDLLARLPEGPERDRRETELQVAIGIPLGVVLGSGAPEVEEAFARARKLSQELGESEQLAALDGLVTFYVTQSRLEDATDLVTKQLALAERLNEPAGLLGAHYSSALIRYFRGDPRAALDHFDQFVEIFDPARHGDLISERGENVGAVSRVWRSWALWMRGYPDQALASGSEGIARAEAVGHAYSLAYALAWVAVLHVNRSEPEEAVEHARASERISAEHGFPIPLGVARLVRFRCSGELGDEESIAGGQEALAQLGATGTQVAVPQILGGFAEFCLECGRPEAATGYLDAAFAVSGSTGQPHWDAELHRIRGEVWVAQGGDAGKQAEAQWARAVEIARSQGAKMLELRAATGWAALPGAAHAAQARAALQDVYGWFSEGFDTADLERAATILG